MPPDRAALYNGFLVRYLDFNDSYLAPGETCHPSDNLAPILAAAESAGRFSIDWQAEDLERVRRTILKRFNAEVHSQATLEATLALREELLAETGEPVDPAAVSAIRVETFDVAHDVIGGGEEGEKTTVRTKEEADHSLPYMTAVMLLDGQVLPAQYRPERIAADDVQELLHKVTVVPVEAYSRRFPDEMPCRVTLTLNDQAGGTELSREVSDYEGFHTRPMSWETVVEKLDRLAEHGSASGPGSAGATDPALRREIVQAVDELASIRVADLTSLLARAG